jgi:UDP-N-acetylglucosamine 2-epimerase (non-hydrolysing)/GDP/UDP-N,N'-diacetylbacillosamine 2-epimerase (hydrolysing)
MKRLLGITGIRSDYDLLSGLYRRLAADATIDFRLLVGGAHMSKTYGYSVDLIREDGIPILATVESLIDADSASARLKSASIMLQFSVDMVSQWKPHLMIYAGDREEVWIGGVLGNYLDIPTVHFYGGDHTRSWHIDNPARHAASKLSTFHVVSTEEHRRRLIAMGEPDSRIAVLGSLALDNFAETVAESDPQPPGLPRPLGDYALVLFHPDPSECDIAGKICKDILLELKAAGLGACIGYPNTDAANRDIIEVYEEFRNEPRFYLYRNLRRREFISLYKRARFIIGNSSSGIVEAASVPIPAVNVGMRQTGRTAGRNVLFVDPDRESIRRGIAAAQEPEFRHSILGMTNPYGDGLSCARAYNLIVNTDFTALGKKVEDPLDLRPDLRSKDGG